MRRPVFKTVAAVLAALLCLAGCQSGKTADPSGSAVSSVPGESSLQMTSFNKNLTPVLRDDACRTSYEIFVYSFCDSDGDGIGDLNGVRSKLDYIADMGFDQIWLTPIHPSSTYHKYDVDDYYGIDKAFGTQEDFDSLIKACHEKGIRVLLDLVLNHTSVNHAWFKAAADYLKKLPSGVEPDSLQCPSYDYYCFAREAKDGYVRLGSSDWYYEARFWSGMPDLNLDNAALKEEIRRIAAFWLGKGVDGFRLDAVTSYYTGNPAANTAFLKWLNETVKALSKDCYLVGEAWTDRASIAELYKSGIDSLFNFPFAGPDGVIRSVMSGVFAASDYVDAMCNSEKAFRAANPGYIDAPFYTNHDIARSAGYFAADDGPVTKMAYALSLFMSGNTFVYYGEEIGMKGSGRDENKRAPMYWSDDKNDPDLCKGPAEMEQFEMKFPSLAEQMKDEASLWTWFREAVRVRRAFPAIARGTTVKLAGICDAKVAAFSRSEGGQTVYILMNLKNQTAEKDLSSLPGSVKLSAVLNTNGEEIKLEAGKLVLPAYSIAVLTGD